MNKEDVSSSVEIVIADKVYINTKNMKPRMQNALRRMAAFSNMNYYKKVAMWLSIKGIPKYIQKKRLKILKRLYRHWRIAA